MCVFVENCLKISVEIRQKLWHDLEKSWPDFGSDFEGLVAFFHGTKEANRGVILRIRFGTYCVRAPIVARFRQLGTRFFLDLSTI